MAVKAAPVDNPNESYAEEFRFRRGKRAHDLLKEAGWSLGPDQVLERCVRNCDTPKREDKTFEKFPELDFPANASPESIMFAKRLRDMGIPVNHHSGVDFAQMRNIMNKGAFDLAWRSIEHPLRPDFTYDNLYSSAAAANPTGSWNWSRLRSPVVDELIKRSKSANTAHDRASALRALDRVLLEESPYVLTLREKSSRFLRRQTCLRQAFELPKKGKVPLYGMATSAWWYEPGCKSQ